MRREDRGFPVWEMRRRSRPGLHSGRPSASRRRHDQRLLAGRGAGVRPALRLHLRLLAEGAAAQGLAAVGETRRLGRVLQSCSDWHQTSCSSCYILHCDGFLCSVHKMSPKASDTQTCLGEPAEKEDILEAKREVNI